MLLARPRIFAVFAIAFVACAMFPQPAFSLDLARDSGPAAVSSHAGSYSLDLGGGYSASLTPPPGWDHFDRGNWSTRNDGNCWVSPGAEATFCVKTVPTGGTKEATEIMIEESEAITFAIGDCSERADSVEEFVGGRAAFSQCIGGIFGDERHSWMAAVIDGAPRGLWMQATEVETSDEIEAAIQAIYPTVKFAGPGIVDPDAGRVFFDLTGGYEASFVPPSGWIQNATTDGDCFRSPDHAANFCVRVVDMGWQNAREYLLPEINPFNCHDKMENQGATAFGTFALAACIVTSTNGPRRQSWLILEVTDAPMGLRIFSDESEENPANWEAIQIASRTFTGGIR